MNLKKYTDFFDQSSHFVSTEDDGIKYQKYHLNGKNVYL